jgi:hypothetical protein
MPTKSRRIDIGVKIFVVALAAVAACWFYLRPHTPSPANSPTLQSQVTSVPSTRKQDQSSITLRGYESAMLQGNNAKIILPAERSNDLRSTFEQFRHSEHPIERHAAYRVWSACFPRFLGSSEKAISLEEAVRGFGNGPEVQARSAALAILYAKCGSFLNHLSREDIVTNSQTISAHYAAGVGLSLGEIATKTLLETGAEPALEFAKEALKSNDPYAIASLQEFTHAHLSKLIDAGALPRAARSDLEAMAFALAACELGLDCAEDGLSATLQCVNNAQCAGRYDERLLSALPSDGDRTQALAAKARVLASIKSKDFAALLFLPR